MGATTEADWASRVTSCGEGTRAKHGMKQRLRIAMSDRQLDDEGASLWCSWFARAYPAGSARIHEANFSQNRLTGVGVAHLLNTW